MARKNRNARGNTRGTSRGGTNRGGAKVRSGKGWAIFAVILSLLVAAALVIGILSDWYTNFWTFSKKKPLTQADAATMLAPDKGLMINQTESQGIMLTAAAMPLSDFETYNVSSSAEAVQTITAIFTPADTTLQKVDYSVAWKNENSSWARGKIVTDYVVLQQSSDGSLDCAVSLNNAIGEQAIITCTARPLNDGDWVPSATCTVDYYMRITGFQMQFVGTTDDGEELSTDYDINLTDGYTLRYEDNYAYDRYGYGWDYENNFYLIGFQYSTGTILEAGAGTTVNVTVSIADGIADSVRSAAGVSSLGSYSLVTGGRTDGLKIKSAVDQILGGSDNVESHRGALYSALKSAYDAGNASLKFDISFKSHPAGFEYNFTYNLKLNPMALGIRATDLDLDKDGVIF